MPASLFNATSPEQVVARAQLVVSAVGRESTRHYVGVGNGAAARAPNPRALSGIHGRVSGIVTTTAVRGRIQRSLTYSNLLVQTCLFSLFGPLARRAPVAFPRGS